MICVTGWNSVIIRELQTVRPDDTIIRPSPGAILPMADRFIYAAGIMHGKSAREIDPAQALETIEINLLGAIKFVERALSTNPEARVCVIGSMSGFNGSYDEIYAASKAGLHLYCRTRAVRPPAQLICVAPGIISDSGMTRRRKDYPKVLTERPTLTARRVAQMISDVLWMDPPFYTNEVIEMPGEIQC